jgi:hypothetical protein
LRRLSARPTLAISCGWLALVILAMLFPDALGTDPGALASLGIVIAGKFAIYWVLAETMASLAREGKRASPAWYLTPLSNHAALLGTLMTALLAIVPPLAGLIAFLPLHASGWMDVDLYDLPSGLAQFGCSGLTIFETTGQYISRLAHFALFAAIIQLALRRVAYAPMLPVVLAAAAVLLGFWQAAFFDPLPDTAGAAAEPWVWTSQTILLGVLCLVVLLFICKWCAELDTPRPLYAVPLLASIAIPLLISLSAVGWLIEDTFSTVSPWQQTRLTQWVYSPDLQPVHAMYSLCSPDASPMVKFQGWRGMRFADNLDKSGARLHFYSQGLSSRGTASGWMLYGLLMALSLIMLWIACMHCLEVSRNPAKRVAPNIRRQQARR